MKRALAAALLAAGCAAPDAPDAACARQAENDPAVRELIVKGAGNPAFLAASQEELTFARRQAVVACLRSRGQAPRDFEKLVLGRIVDEPLQEVEANAANSAVVELR